MGLNRFDREVLSVRVLSVVDPATLNRVKKTNGNILAKAVEAMRNMFAFQSFAPVAA